MRLADAIEKLQRCGLTRHEAATFLNLAKFGAATARELTKSSGVNRVQTYRALDSLQARGLVEVSLGRPRRYTARALQEAFELVLEERRAELAAIEEIRTGLLAAWPKRPVEGTPDYRIQILKGRTQIYGALRRAILAAEQEVVALTTAKGISRSYRGGINEALLTAMGRGIRGKLIADISRENATLFGRVAERVPLRHLGGQKGRFIIIDRKAAFAFLVQDERHIGGEGEAAMWTDSPDFVRSLLEIFDRSWTSAVGAEARFRELAQA